MPVWAWILIAVGALALIAIVGYAVWARQRSSRLREHFGPEYDRAIAEQGDRRHADAELASRRKRREELEIRPLEPAARRRYLEQWRDVQVRFVDTPAQAVTDADRLVTDVMRERGYPIDDFEERETVVSVDHPQVVHNYRAAHGISMANDQGRASTEDLREAMLHYRSLFDELLEGDGTESVEETG